MRGITIGHDGTIMEKLILHKVESDLTETILHQKYREQELAKVRRDLSHQRWFCSWQVTLFA